MRGVIISATLVSENSKILLCLDEKNEPVFYFSDKYGFNNIINEKNDFLLIGDSYVQGMCVNNKDNLRTNAWTAPTDSAVSASAGDKLFINTLSGAKTVTLPSSATMGDEIRVIDAEGNASTNNITIGRNSHRIMGADSDFIINLDRAAIGFVYYNDSNGWLLIEN